MGAKTKSLMPESEIKGIAAEIIMRDWHPSKKPGRKKGSGEKPCRFNMRSTYSFKNYLAFIRQNKMSVYFGKSDAEIIDGLVTDAVSILELSYDTRYLPGIKY